MSKILNSLAAFGLFSAVLGASTAAHAATLVSYDDIGIGNFSGYNPLNIIDGPSASISVDLAETSGLVTTDVVAETLVGSPFQVTQHGSQVGTGDSYLAGFTFNLGTASYIEYVPSSSGQTWTWTKGVPTLSGGVVTTGAQIGSTDQTDFTLLAPGKYTLLFSGIVDNLVGSTSFGGSVSAVPLPGSLVMFGSALIGLTAFGARRRRSGLAV